MGVRSNGDGERGVLLEVMEMGEIREEREERV